MKQIDTCIINFGFKVAHIVFIVVLITDTRIFYVKFLDPDIARKLSALR